MKKFQFAVILTEEKETILVIDNDGIYKSAEQWQRRFKATNAIVLYCSETDKIDLSLSHYFL